MRRRTLLTLAAGALYAGPLEDRIRRIEARWGGARALTDLKVPAVSIAVIRDGAVEWQRAYGVGANTTTLFQAASISKPVAAMAALHMAQNGNFTLDEDVNGKLHSWRVPENEFTREKKVTVARLLSHSAGLTVHGFPGYAEGESIPAVQQILDGVPPANTKTVRVDMVPGTKFRYSGGGYTVLQLLLQERFKQPFAELMEKLVLQRLNMRNSTYEQPLPQDRAARAAVGFHETGRSYTGGWHTYPEMAAAGLWTTPQDLCLFAIEVAKSVQGQSNKIVNRDMARRMTSVHIEQQGLGFAVRDKWFQHGGANAGYRCMLTCRADCSHGAVVMTNSDAGGKAIDPILKSIAAESAWPEFS